MAILQKSAPEISVILINYNTNQLIQQLLHSLGQDSYFEIVIIDNSDTDSLKNSLKSENIRYIFSGKNLGFAAGANLGAAYATGKWLFFLNSDTECTGNNLKKLYQQTVQHRAIVSGPQLFHDTIENTVGTFDSSNTHFLNWLFLRPHFINCSNIIQPTFFDLATGGALFIKKSLFTEIGGFDDKNYFMYFEDMDLCYRLYKKNIHILYIPEIKILHLSGQSSQSSSVKMRLYHSSLYNYLKKNRGLLVAYINKFFKTLR